MTLSTGSRLGPYEILEPIGAGGMGEVYRARDTRLDRPVAIKVLAPHLAASAEVRQRFEREARTISKLSHAHICALFDVGREGEVEYLVMELLEGESLAERLARGALPLEQTLRFGAQIADALDKAHRQGIIHRDLKPGNVMLTKSGVKLLDFGLAKAVEAPSPQSSQSVLPTQASPVTQAGTVLGTFQYMAPEQLEGKEADARADIFALGAVVFEMATGRKAFAGSSQASLIAAILQNDPPPISSVQPLAPQALDRVVRGCLAKDPEDRTQSAHDVAAELRWIAEGSQSGSGASAPAAPRVRRHGREVIAWIVAAAALAGLAAALWSVRRSPVPPERRLEVTLLPADGTMGWGPIALSRDGRQLAYVAVGEDGRQRLYVRALDRLESRALPGTEDARYPFWSPDGRALGFFDGAWMNRIDLAGGPARHLAPIADPRGGTWNAEGAIVFSPSPGAGLFRVAAAGGPVVPLTTLDAKRQETSHRWPNFLPDGKHVLMLVRRPAQNERLTLEVVAVADGKRQPLVEADSSAGYSAGRVFFLRETTLFAQSFDAATGKLSGDAAPLVENVWRDSQMDGLTSFSLAPGGELAYRRGGFALTQFAWFDRSGKRLRSVGSPGVYARPRLAPDGRRLITDVTEVGRSNAYMQLIDGETGAGSSVTFGHWNDSQVVWSPDGMRIAYSSDRNGPFDIFIKDAAGGGAEKPLVESANWKYPESWSSDGRWLLYREIDPKTKGDLWLLPMAGSGGKPTPYLTTSADEREPSFSPDGRFIAYASDESGSGQIYVQPNPPTGQKWRVSNAGGMWPRWREDGHELYYMQPDRKIMAVEVAADGATTLRIGNTLPLFVAPVRLVNLSGGEFDVSKDGTRFLVNEAIGETIASPVNLVLGGSQPAK